MAFGGLVCGLIALVLSASVRGRFAKQLFLHRLIDGFSVVPGIALFLWPAPMDDPSRGLESFQLLGLFMLTYTGTRIIAHKWTRVWSVNREQTLPFKRSEEHTSELQSRLHLVCRLLLEKKKEERAAQG